MTVLFDAVQSMFNGDKVLTGKARKLVEGMGEEDAERPPYVTFDVESSHRDNDTFDSDIEVFTTRFRIKTKSAQPKDAGIVVEELKRVFHDSHPQHGQFQSSSMRHADTTGPGYEDGRFDAEMGFTVEVQWL